MKTCGLRITFDVFMKKLIASIVAVCYFVVTCGVVINFHYCMDRLASTSLFSVEAKKCGQCGMEIHQSNGCCHDEVKIVKMNEDQNKTLIAVYEIPSFDPIAITPSAYIAAAFYHADEQRHFHNHSPPLLSAQDTYLQNNVFRI